MKAAISEFLEDACINEAIFQDTPRYIETVRKGISGAVLRKAVGEVASRDLFATILNTHASNLHRFYARKALSPEASEEILDTLRVFRDCQAVWGSPAMSQQWLNSPVPALGGAHPMTLFDTYAGRRWVQQVLRKIESGDYS